MSSMGRKKKDDPQERTSFFLPQELKYGLERLKEDIGVPETESVRRALREYLMAKGYNIDQLKIDAAADRAAKKKRMKR
jgi:hypothetical protein